MMPNACVCGSKCYKAPLSFYYMFNNEPNLYCIIISGLDSEVCQVAIDFYFFTNLTNSWQLMATIFGKPVPENQYLLNICCISDV